MLLKNVTYSEYDGHPREWSLGDLSLSNINLIVGRNGTGKTRVANIISGFASMISSKPKQLYKSGNHHFRFLNGDDEYIIEINFNELGVSSEMLSINGEKLLVRSSDGSGEIYNSAASQTLPFKVTNSDIALVDKRDSIQHPFLEPLHRWARTFKRYNFGSEFGHRSIWAFTGSELTPSESQVIRVEPDQVVAIYAHAFTNFGGSFDEQLVADFSRIGYPCTSIDAAEIEELKLPNAVPIMLSVQEQGLAAPTRQVDMSVGMYRALALLINLNSLVFSKQSGCVLIDDIGEGLDYERSTQVIQLLVERCSAHDIQLIMMSNDRFVMNAIDLKHWNVLHRQGCLVRSINSQNKPEVFDRFRYSGLNNFDFFASTAYLD